MCISVVSSDVCSSDLVARFHDRHVTVLAERPHPHQYHWWLCLHLAALELLGALCWQPAPCDQLPSFLPCFVDIAAPKSACHHRLRPLASPPQLSDRSEERRVGKECVSTFISGG